MSPVEKANMIRRSRDLEARISNGWEWLKDPANRNKPNYISAEDAWLEMLAEFESLTDQLSGREDRKAA
jgi:hypothetical protein